jgi:hypothetical protein
MTDPTLPSAPAFSDEPAGGPASTAPQPVRLAAIGIFVLAVLNLVGIAVAATSRSRIVDSLHKSSPKLTSSQIDAAATISVVFAAVVSIVFAVLFVWLGVKTLAGRNWARVTVTVFLALGVISGLYGLVRPTSAVGLILGVVELVIEIAVLALLWAPAPARAYFAPRRPGPA